MKLIGNLNFKYRDTQIIDELTTRLKSCKYEIKNINHSPSNLCALPNGYLLAANCITQNLILYDAEFNLIKTFFAFNNRSIYPLSLTTNGIDRVYITDSYNHRVLMTDLDLNLLYELGSMGSLVDEFNYPCGIIYHDFCVYICDSHNKRIQVYDTSMVYKRSNVVDFAPFEIKCTKSYACIRDNDKRFVYFYDLATFEIKVKHEGHNGTIFEIYGCIYEYYNENSIIYVYSDEGEIVESVKIDILEDDIKFNGFESICYFNKKFILATENCKKLCLI
jgi:hypothetical protein